MGLIPLLTDLEEPSFATQGPRSPGNSQNESRLLGGQLGGGCLEKNATVQRMLQRGKKVVGSLGHFCNWKDVIALLKMPRHVGNSERLQGSASVVYFL